MLCLDGSMQTGPDILVGQTSNLGGGAGTQYPPSGVRDTTGDRDGTPQRSREPFSQILDSS